MLDDIKPFAPAYVGAAQGIFPEDAGPLAQAEIIRLRLRLEKIEARAALAQPAAPAESKPAAKPVYLVATGETYEGEEQYTRHDTPPSLCDYEKLYTAQPAAPACPGIPRPGCSYYAACGTVCNKCGEVHSAHLLMPQPAVPADGDGLLGRAFLARVEADCFEDGVDADLRDSGIGRLADAWIAGRQDFIREVRDTAAAMRAAAQEAP